MMTAVKGKGSFHWGRMGIPMSANGALGRIAGQGEVDLSRWGRSYVGLFVDDLGGWGGGTITYPDGSSYAGDWSAGRDRRDRHRKLCQRVGL